MVNLRRVAIVATVVANLKLFKGLPWRVVLGRKVTLALGRDPILRVRKRLTISLTPNPIAVTRIQLDGGSHTEIDGYVEIGNGCFIRVADSAQLRIGDKTYINSGTRISSSDSVVIGRGCLIGFDVLIQDNDYHSMVVDGVRRPTKAPIVIGDRVWIGARAIILKGVTIGPGSVVGAGAVVTRDVPANSLVVGSPTQIVRRGIEWDG